MESLPQERLPRDRRRARSSQGPADCEAMGAGMATAEAANDVRMSQLARTIEQEIIPRLMLAHRPPVERGPVVAEGSARPIEAGDVEHFAKLVLAPDEDLAFESLQAYRSRGVTIEDLYLHLLAPTARFLGDLWTEDLCDFTDVTVGLGRLQRVLRELSPEFGRTVDHPLDGRRVLLLPSPGEQHTFGLSMVAEFFRHARWDVNNDAWGLGTDAPSLVAAEWFDVIGFSLGAAIHVQALAETIRGVREASCNRDIAVVVGGPLFGEYPEYVAFVGADGMTIDGREAPVMAEQLIVRGAVRAGAGGIGR